jgi:hypothetical protein
MLQYDTFKGKASEMWKTWLVCDLSKKYESIRLVKYKSDFTAVQVRWENGATQVLHHYTFLYGIRVITISKVLFRKRMRKALNEKKVCY